MSRINYRMQTLTAGELGSTLSLCLCVEKSHIYSQETKILARYLFNVGDNLPRAAQENKIKLKDVRYLGLSSLFPHNMGGLPALILALSDLGVARVHVAGPPGLHGCLHHATPFTNRRFPEISSVEVEHDMEAEVYEDEYLIIQQSPVKVARPDGSFTAVGVNFVCQPKFPGLTTAVFAVAVHFSQHGGVAAINDLKEQHHCKMCFFVPLDDSVIGDDRIAELDEEMTECLRILPGIHRENDSYHVLQQRTLDMYIRNMICDRHFLPPKLLPHVSHSDELPDTHRVSLTEDALAAIRSAVATEREGRHDDLNTTMELTGCHFAAPLSQYGLTDLADQEAAKSDLESEESSTRKRQRREATSISLRSAKRCTQASILSRLAPIRNLVRAIMGKQQQKLRPPPPPGPPPPKHLATESGQQQRQHLENKDAAARLRAKLMGAPAPPPRPPPPPSTPPPPPTPRVTSESHVGPPAASKLEVPDGDIRVIFLGTGSAAPSKHRNSTAILLLFKDNERRLHSVVLDAGDGLYGQLVACFDGEDLRQLLLSIRMVWISHKHADHQCGLPRLFSEIRKLHGPSVRDGTNVIAIAPQEVLSYVFFVGCLSGYDDLIECISCSDMNKPNNATMNMLRSQSANCIQTVYSARVEHCYDAYALKVGVSNKIIIYSGDCRPSQRLSKVGERCDLLIHEATFDDELTADAVKKRHSTVGEAVTVAQDMQARCCVLTHFSQRYPVMPAMSPQQHSRGESRVLSAWDFFTFCLLSEQHSASEACNRVAAVLTECSQLLSTDEL